MLMYQRRVHIFLFIFHPLGRQTRAREVFCCKKGYKRWNVVENHPHGCYFLPSGAPSVCFVVQTLRYISLCKVYKLCYFAFGFLDKTGKIKWKTTDIYIGFYILKVKKEMLPRFCIVLGPEFDCFQVKISDLTGGEIWEEMKWVTTSRINCMEGHTEVVQISVTDPVVGCWSLYPDPHPSNWFDSEC